MARTRPSPPWAGKLDSHPLPVHYVDLCAWFYPAVGHGRLSLSTYEDRGTDDLRHEQVLYTTFGPFDDVIPVRRAEFRWAHLTARMTGWSSMLGAFPEPSGDAGSG